MTKYLKFMVYKNLSDIDPNDYEPLKPDNFTALYDATYDAIAATLEYSKRLSSQDFDCNGAVYIITDGMNNRGKMTPHSIKDKVKESVAFEDIESLVTILVGLHDPNTSWQKEVQKALTEFQVEAELSQFVDAGDATPGKLAKLANFVSESISSQSQALGSGAPSQTLTF